MMQETINFKDLTKKFHDFFREYKENEIKKAFHEGKKTLYVDFQDITNFDFTLAEELLKNPQDVLRIMSESLNFFSEQDNSQVIQIRLTSLPQTEYEQIRNIRTEHLEKIFFVEGTVKIKSSVRPRILHIDYLCSNPSCSSSQEKISVPQIEQKIRKLKNCPKCKSGLEEIKKHVIDNQLLVLEELSEHLPDQVQKPERINVLLQDDLVSPFNDLKTNPGQKVKIIGILQEVPKTTKSGSESVDFDWILKANYVSSSSQEIDLKVTPQEEKDIKEFAQKENVAEILSHQVAPSIFGYNRIKEAVVIQAVGGVKEENPDGTHNRGDIHILLIGDPGAAKSQMLKAATQIAPKSRYVSGKATSSAGLIAGAYRDEFTNTWGVEAGAMVMASGGILAVDELNLVDDEDKSSLNSGMEQQKIEFAKMAHATLTTETSVLAAANPKFGRFDPYADVGKQLNLEPALLSRFDFIFVLRDIPDKKKDDLISGHISRKKIKDPALLEKLEKEGKIPAIVHEEKLSTNFLRKYFHYVRSMRPKLSEEAFSLLKDFYVKIRVSASDDGNGIKAVPITARQFEGLLRVAEGYAKLNLSEQVTQVHAQKAIDLVMYCLEKIGIDPQTGRFDIDRITTGITASKRNKFKLIREILENFNNNGKEEIKREELFSLAQEKDISKEDVEKVIEEFKSLGSIYEPKKDILKIIMFD